MFRLISFSKKFDAVDGMHYIPIINGETPKVLCDTFGAGIVEMTDGTRLFVSTDDGNTDCVFPIHTTDEELERLINNELSSLDVLWTTVF